MLNLILIAICILLNTIFMGCLCVMFKQKRRLTWKNYAKYASGAWAGLALSLLCKPITLQSVILLMLIAASISEGGVVFFYSIKEAYKKAPIVPGYDNGSPAKFFITGDKHRNFDSVRNFCQVMNTRRKDVLIVLGDAGFNYYDDSKDDALKKEVSELNITLFCLHGNKENRPQNIATYGLRSFCGGKVYYEPKYPNIFFAIDGEIYTFEGKKYMVVGGAHSVDKLRCLKEDLPWWEDEMPDDEIKALVESKLQSVGNSIYGMLTHTCPIDYLPREMFVSTRQNADMKRKPKRKKVKNQFKPDIDRSTEIWLGELEKELDYKIWFCGHYHVDKQIDKIHMMHSDIRPLHLYENNV